MVFTIGHYQVVLFQVRRRADGPADPYRGVSAAEIERRMQEHRNTMITLWQMQPR